MPTETNITSQIKNNSLYITMDLPEKHNCFGMAELEEIHRLLYTHQTVKDVKAVVFKGAGNQSFSTGANLKQFTSLDKPGTVHWIKKGHDVFNFIEQYPKPTIAVIQGYALGGGLELALACDFRIASDNAVFGSPELRHGWLPGWGGIHRLKKLIGEASAKEIIFLSDHISAKEAYRLGLIHRITTTSELEDTAESLLEKLTQLNPEAFSMAKAALSQNGYPATTPQQIWFDILSTLISKTNTK